MEEVVMYKCGVCGKVYDTEEKCEACEAECRKTEPLVVYTMDYRPMNLFDDNFEVSVKTHSASEGLKPTEDRDTAVDPEWSMDEEGPCARWMLVVYESEKDIYQDLEYLEGQFRAWYDAQYDKLYAATKKVYEQNM